MTVLRRHGWRAATRLTTFRVSKQPRLFSLSVKRCNTWPCECDTGTEDQGGAVSQNTQGRRRFVIVVRIATAFVPVHFHVVVIVISSFSVLLHFSQFML